MRNERVSADCERGDVAGVGKLDDLVLAQPEVIRLENLRAALLQEVKTFR